MAEVCLIIPTYGNFDYAYRCIESFIATTENVDSHVLVIDDASDKWDPDYEWPQCNLSVYRFEQRAGLTRSWNYGLYIAKQLNHTYTICANSDLLFVGDWYNPLKQALEVHDLVGPITNTPGHCTHQNIDKFGITITSDDPEALNNCAEHCSKINVLGTSIVTHRINGFCMMAKTNTWWSCSYDAVHVFDPAMKLTGNEDEYQRRLYAKCKSVAYVPHSFVFHYRSVSRPEALFKPESKGAYRHGEGFVK